MLIKLIKQLMAFGSQLMLRARKIIFQSLLTKLRQDSRPAVCPGKLYLPASVQIATEYYLAGFLAGAATPSDGCNFLFISSVTSIPLSRTVLPPA